MSKKLTLIFMLILLVWTVTAWTPTGDINLRDYYDITNGVNASFVCLEVGGEYRCSWPGLGNPFDQSLNTTDNVMFQNLNLTGRFDVNNNSFFGGALMPLTTLLNNIGSGLFRWGDLFVSDISADDLSINDIILTGDITGPFGNFTSLMAINITGSIDASNITNEYWVNESGDKMTGDLNMSLNDITGVGRITLKEDGDIYFGSSNARIYSGGTDYIYIEAHDTVELHSNNEIIFRADGDLNDFHVFGVTDYGATDTPYFGTLYSDMELRPALGVVNTFGNMTAYNFKGNLSWTNLTDYPVACLEGYAVTKIDDEITCTAFVSDDSLYWNMSGGFLYPRYSGNVGIGTASPDFKLQVNGSIAPETTNVSSFGSTALRWLKGWFNGLDVKGDVLIDGNINITGNVSYIEPYITSYDNSTQTMISTSVAQVVNISNNADIDRHQMNIVNRQNITFQETGDYFCMFSPQFFQNGGGSRVNFWYQINGVDVKWSNSRYSMSNNEYNAPGIGFQFDIHSVTDTVRFMWSSDSTSTQIYSSGDLTTPTRPSVPGIILNCHRVSNLSP